jgi:hypothetical protein
MLIPSRKPQRRRITLDAAEFQYAPKDQDPERLLKFPELELPFGFQNAKWEELKLLMEPGDQLWECCSSRQTWKDLMGTEWIELVRDGKAIALIVTRFN